MDASDIYKALEELSDEDLDLIYRRCEFVRSARMRMVRPGQHILWVDKQRREYTGTVERVNQKTVTLIDTNHPRFSRGVRVPMSWVRPA